jgi:hypothetical protein
MQALERAKRPEMNGIVALSVRGVRAIDGLTVEHTPIPQNRAHTDVFGLSHDEPERLMRRDSLCEICNTWLIDAFRQP